MSNSPGLFARAMHIFRERPLLYLGTAALPYFTVHLILWSVLFFLPAMQFAPGTPLKERMHSLTSLQLAELLLALALWATVPYALAGRGLCRIASRQIESASVSFGQIMADMALFIPSAIFLSLIVGLATGIGMGAFFVPGLFIDALFTLVIPAGAVENLGPFAALNRGLKLATRAYGKLLGLYFAFGLTVVVAFAMQVLFFNDLPQTISARLPVFALITLVPLFPLVIFNICLTLIFYDLRNVAAAPSPMPVAAT